MKQKYTVSIADLQLSLITDATAEDVEKISGILDRKMREIYLKSRCPRTEAALLCAMEFVADRLSLQEHAAELEDRCEKYDIVLENFKEKCDLQATELERLQSENAVLRSLLTRAPEEAAPAEELEEEHVALDPISPTAFLASVADAQTAPAEEPEAEEALSDEPVQITIEDEAPAAEAPAEADPEAEAAAKRRSRVGSMFDLLSFGEAD